MINGRNPLDFTAARFVEFLACNFRSMAVLRGNSPNLTCRGGVKNLLNLASSHLIPGYQRCEGQNSQVRPLF